MTRTINPDGVSGGPMIVNKLPAGVIRLQQAGVSWKARAAGQLWLQHGNGRLSQRTRSQLTPQSA